MVYDLISYGKRPAMKPYKNHREAFQTAALLAITAPTEALSIECAAKADLIASQLTEAEVEQCKANVLAILQENFIVD